MDTQDIRARGVDFWYFLREVLGCKRREDLQWEDLLVEHEELARFLQFDGHRNKLIMMPRYSLKSTICTVGYSLWRVVMDPNIRILIYSESATKAIGFLGEIKGHFEGVGEGRFKKICGDMTCGEKSGNWNESAIVVNNRKVNYKEPTIDTGGIETGKVGSHYDLIIFDDIVSDLNTTSKAQCDKVWDCYKKSLSLLKPGGEVVVVGTRWHFGDAYGRMIDEAKGGDKWGIFIKRAIENDRYVFERIGLTKEFLDNQKASQGTFLWSCLYQNNPVDDSSAVFKYEDFSFYDPKFLDMDKLYKTCVCDPAGEGGDYTAFTVVGTDDKMRMYLLYASNDHLKPNQIVDKVIELSYAYKFVKFGIETNFFNGMLEKELNLALQEERSNPKYKPFGVEVFRATCKRGEGKHARILSLQPYHERGHLIFPNPRANVETLRGAYNELAYQMLQYTESHRPIHDDLLDSLAYQVNIMRAGQSDVMGKPAENTFIGLLEDHRVEMNRLQKKVPLKYRKYNAESFLSLK